MSVTREIVGKERLRQPERDGAGRAWTELRVEILRSPPVEKGKIMPATKEPEIVWVLSGGAVVEEREVGGQWLRTEVAKGDFFLTAPGPAYELRFETKTTQPFEVMFVTLSLTLLKRAMAEVYGEDARAVHLCDVSGFRDEFMSALVARLLQEYALRDKASRLFVRGAAETLAVHLARHYSVASEGVPVSKGGFGLPAFKLRRITELLAGHMDDGFSLSKCAAEAGMSEFHFSRMFKRATGKSPSQFFIGLKMEKARSLLRETNRDVIEIALDLGYTSPSHFAQVFRRQTGRSPAEYRRQHSLS